MEFNFDTIRDKVISIMLKHPECFPILKFAESEKTGIIFAYIGLDKIIGRTIDFYSKIPILNLKIIPELQTIIIQEILFQYFIPTFTDEDNIVRSYKY